MSHVCVSVSRACQAIRCRSSVLCVRGFHTAISIAVPVVLFVKKSDLHSSVTGSSSPVYCICYILLLLLSLCMYHTACLVDPGYVPKETSDIPRDGEEDDDDDEGSSEKHAMLKPDSGSLRYCEYCEIEQPMRARHCEDCDRCVLKYDHHCPWLETCVGERNHKFFWLFLVSKSCLILWSAVIAWRAVEHKDTWESWLMSNIILVLVMFILVTGGFTVISLLCFHTYLMFTNSTTWESVSRPRISYLRNLSEDYNPFHMGYCRNVRHFMCKCSAQQWSDLYKRSVKKLSAENV